MNIHQKMINWQENDGVKLFKDMRIPLNAVVVDFGCGYGEYTVAVALAMENKGTIYAVDKDNKALKILKNKIDECKLNNVYIRKNNGELLIQLENKTVDFVIMYDFIHGNDIKTKLPIRYKMFKESWRVLKEGGILSIAPFDCEYLRDSNGKRKKYSIDQLIQEIEESGFELESKHDGAIHFEKYHSPYQWKIHNDNLKFEDMEKGYIYNYIKVNKVL